MPALYLVSDPVASGVPQGSVLGSLLFLLYTADIPLIASEHRIEAHFYADDGQLYLFGRAGEAESKISRVTECIADIDTWMSSNRLKLNSDKTQFIWLGTRYQRQKVDITSIQLGISEVKFQSNVNDLGVIIDDLLSMKDHVQRICRSSYYQLRQLRTVRKSLSMESCEALIHAFVSSRLDYCNSLLYGINKLQLDLLQSVLRASARLIFRKRKFDSISLEIRDKLHWLPVRKRIEFKICTTVYKCLHGGAPPYLVEMMLPVTDTPALRRLRSATRGDLIIPSSKTVRFGPRSFNVSGPTLWNSLPVNIRQCKSFESFKKQLKTFLYLRADST